jgi:hypothetical protein
LRKRNDTKYPGFYCGAVASLAEERNMKSLRMVVLATLIGTSMGAVLAQPGGGRGSARWGSDYTPGWALMTQQERNEHRERMRSMKTYEECNAYQDQHHEQMAARAKERGGKTLAQPRRDACSGLKK